MLSSACFSFETTKVRVRNTVVTANGVVVCGAARRAALLLLFGPIVVGRLSARPGVIDVDALHGHAGLGLHLADVGVGEAVGAADGVVEVGAVVGAVDF